MAKIITAPEKEIQPDRNKNKLFLAGGITNCLDWQSITVNFLKEIPDTTIYNPRRQNFPMDNPNAAEEQIKWEYEHLKKSNIIAFWFSRGSLNPISLYELGKWGNSSSIPIIIGVDDEYKRKKDVIIQTKLARPQIKVQESFDFFLYEIYKTITGVTIQ
jgi:hypothetical protein